MKYAIHFNIFTAINTYMEQKYNGKDKSLIMKLKNILQHEFVSWREHFHNDVQVFTEAGIDYNEKQAGLNQYSLSSKYYQRKHNARTWSRHSALISIWEEQRHK